MLDPLRCTLVGVVQRVRVKFFGLKAFDFLIATVAYDSQHFLITMGLSVADAINLAWQVNGDE
ncbi:hypothetical protein HUU62_24060 [Rhodoferax sp. 4810]|nr:hypothetical protein [Rhodoferax jenense]